MHIYKVLKNKICKTLQAFGFISCFMGIPEAMDNLSEMPVDLHKPLLYCSMHEQKTDPRLLKRVCSSFYKILETEEMQNFIKKENTSFTRRINGFDCSLGCPHIIDQLKKYSHIFALIIELPQQYPTSFYLNISHSTLVSRIIKEGFIYTPKLFSLTIQGAVTIESLLTNDESDNFGLLARPLTIDPSLAPLDVLKKPQLAYLKNLRELTISDPLEGDKALVDYFTNTLLPALPKLTFTVLNRSLRPKNS